MEEKKITVDVAVLKPYKNSKGMLEEGIIICYYTFNYLLKIVKKELKLWRVVQF